MSWAQSYPTQRVEGSDTVVVMTVKQAQNINDVFAKQKAEIKYLRETLDSLQTTFKMQDSLWANLSNEQSKEVGQLLQSISYNQRTIIELEKQVQGAEKTQRTSGLMFFTFFAAFVSYLHFFN